MEPKFKIGDKVIYTNDYGAVYKDKTVSGVSLSGWAEGYSYLISPTDTPWFYHPEIQLTKQEG